MVTEDDALVEGVRRDWRTAQITDAERAMLEYVEALTLRPATLTRQDLDALRTAGFDDTGILQITLIASYFASINRIADGLGVGKP
jgi:uncharacterized peroxidase-related enzyme